MLRTTTFANLTTLLKDTLLDTLLIFKNVRRVALVTFNSAAHNKPSLIRDLLEAILPQLYSETKVRVRAAFFTFLDAYLLNFVNILSIFCF